MRVLENSGKAIAIGVFLVGAAAFMGCGDDRKENPSYAPNPYDFEFNLPEGFPVPLVPADNPMTDEKVELGRHLFYDVRVSGNGTESCGTCHLQEHGFAELMPHSVGSTGDDVPRNSMSLTNVAYLSTLTWASPVLLELEAQALVPLFGEFPVELGLTGNEEKVIERLRAEPMYADLFAKAYPDQEDPFNVPNVVSGITSFVRTMISGDSPYDQYTYQGKSNAISASAKRGEGLFYSERLECHHCHGGFNFTQATRYVGIEFHETSFHNTGLYNVDGEGAYPASDTGLISVTLSERDMGVYRAPTLRNIAVTGPYYHDGSEATLEGVIRNYEAGGRNLTSGPNAGDGRENPHKSPFVHGFTITDQEREDLLHFLESLTDSTFLENEKFANPWM